MTKRLSEKRKRFAALTLAAALIFTAVPMTAHASSLDRPTGLKETSKDDDEIELRWNPVEGASGYEVWRYSTSLKKWVLEEREDDNEAEIDDLLSANIYKFKVRPFVVKSDGSLVYGSFSGEYKTITEPKEVNNLRALSRTKNTVTLSWNSVKRADKYQVYIYDKDAGKWDRLITTSKTSYKVKDLDSGTSYKFRVRPYREALDEKVYGDYESITVKTTSNTTSASSAISSSEAKKIALSYAGVSSSSATFTEVERDSDDGTAVYEIEFYAGNYEYELEINAETGAVRDYDKDYRWDD